MNKKILNILILRYLSDDIQDTDKNKLELWLGESEMNREYFDKIKKAWFSVKITQPSEIPDFEEFWKEIGSKLNITDNSAVKKQNKTAFENFISVIFSRPSLAITGAVSIAAAAIIICMHIFGINQAGFSYYSTANGQRLEVTLPDGSTVKLNSGSEIKFDNRFKESRNIELKGEAFFSVTKNNTPFVVKTSNASVQVKGTKFNVKVRNGKTSVVVADGLVLFRPLIAPNKKSVLLAKGEMSECVNDSITLKPVIVNVGMSTSWLKNTLLFDNTPLSEISDELIRTYNVKINIEGNDIGKKTLTGEFRNRKIEEVLSAVCLSLNLQYKYQSGTYTIYSAE